MKLVVIEDGSDVAVELWDTGDRTASSILSYAEGRAALAAAGRKGRLADPAYADAVAHFESLQAELLLLGLDMPLVRHAGELAEDLGLRGYDAVHLASALAIDEDATLVTWDAGLARAAYRSGCAVAPALPRSG